ncbi:MAG: PAS domain-containing protein [Cyanobacteriota bacterium]|jgi:PAS domain-containing protein
MEFKAFLDACPLGIFIIDAQGHPYYANLKAIELLGKGVLPSAPLDRLNAIYQAYQSGTNQLYPATEQPLLRALAGETCRVTDLEVHQGGQIIPLEVTAAPVPDSAGQICFALAVLEDIQERREETARQERLQQDLLRRNQRLQQENARLQRQVQLLQGQLEQLEKLAQGRV